jgi:hypothetical protein
MAKIIKVSINFKSLKNLNLDCEDSDQKDVTNFNMVDEDLNNAIKYQKNKDYEHI